MENLQLGSVLSWVEVYFLGETNRDLMRKNVWESRGVSDDIAGRGCYGAGECFVFTSELEFYIESNPNLKISLIVGGWHSEAEKWGGFGLWDVMGETHYKTGVSCEIVACMGAETKFPVAIVYSPVGTVLPEDGAYGRPFAGTPHSDVPDNSRPFFFKMFRHMNDRPHSKSAYYKTN